MTLKQSVQIDLFNAGVLDWLDDVLAIVKNWANDWISKAENLDTDIEALYQKHIMEEDNRKVNSPDNSTVINRLVDVLKSFDKIRRNMYKIINKSYNERLLVAKESAETRLSFLILKNDTLTKELSFRKNLLRRRELEKKWKSDESNSTFMNQKIREKALKEHKKYLAHRDAIETLQNIDNHSIISDGSDIRDSTLLEEQSPTVHCKRQRRSRSLTRRVMGSVKKTIRRSVSAIHSYIENHHHDN
ncbi:unnamed protein product [Caenorhabditis brenneri]